MAPTDPLINILEHRRGDIRSKDQAEVLQGHLFAGAFVLLAIIGAVFVAAYLLFLRDYPVVMWVALAVLAIVLLIAGWRFFRTNGALVTGLLLGRV